MSNVMDRKVVEMQFDNAQFEKGVRTSMSTLDKLKESLKFEGIEKGFENIERSSRGLDFDGIKTNLSKVGDKFSILEQIAIGALRRMGEQAFETGKRFVKSLSVDNVMSGWEKYKDKTGSVGTLIAQGFDVSTVNEQLDRLNWYTDETSYSFTNMVAEIAKFTATGKGLEESVDALMGIANWAAVSGQNASTASRAMYQLSQAMGSGIMRKEDYKSIQNVSMDTAEFRQKALDAGVALGTLKKNADGTYQSIVKGAKSSKFNISQFADHLTQDAWFTSDVMMAVYRDYGNAIDKIYSYAEENDVTASQAIRELGDELDEFGVKAFKAAQEARSWQDAVDSVKEATASAFMQTFEILFGQYDDAVSLWTDLANRFYDAFAQPINDFNSLLKDGLQTHTTYVNDYFTETYGTASDAIERASELVKKFGADSNVARRYIKALALENEDIADLITNYVQLYKLGGDGSKTIRATSDAIVEYTSKVTGASKEDVAALKEIGDQFGYNSSKYKSQMNKVFGKGNRDIFETATALLAVTNGIRLVEQQDLDSYLENTLKMTSDQVEELHNLADEYGANSVEVSEYLNKLDKLKGFGNSKDLANVRKAIVGLLEVSDTNWKSGDIVGYISNLTGASEENVKILKKLLAEKKELENAELEDSEAIEANTKAREKNAEEIEKFADEISNGDEALKKQVLDLMDLNDNLNKMSGYQNILNAFNSAWDYFASILSVIKEAFNGEDGVFSSLEASNIYQFTVRIKEAAENLTLSEEAADRLKRVFKGFFSIFKIIGQVVKYATMPVKAFFSILFESSDDLKSGAASVGDWITKLADSGKVAEKAEKAFSKLAEIFAALARGIKDILSIKKAKEVFESAGKGILGVFAVVGDKVRSVAFAIIDFIASIIGWDPTEFKNKIIKTFGAVGSFIGKIFSKIDFEKIKDRIVTAFNTIKEFLSRIFKKRSVGADDSSSEDSTISALNTLAEKTEAISDRLSGLKKSISTFIEGIKNVFSKFKQAFAESGLGKALTVIWEKIKEIGRAIGSFLSESLQKVGEKLKEIDVKDIMSFLTRLVYLISAVGGAILGFNIKSGIKKFVKNAKDIPSAIKDVIDKLGTLLDGLGDVIKTFKKKIEVKIFKDIAISLLLMAVALVAMAMVPADRLAAASGALINMTGALVGMVGAMKGLNKDGSFAKDFKAKFDSKVFLKLAEAILIIAISLRLLKDMDPAQIAAASGAIVVLLGSMLTIAVVLGKTKNMNYDGIKKASSGLVVFAIAIGVVVMSVKSIAKLKPEQLISSMIAVEALLATMIVSAIIMGKMKNPSNVVKASSGLLILAITLRLVVWSVKSLAKLEPERLIPAAIAVGALMLAMTTVAGVMSKMKSPSNVVKASAGLIILAAALGIIALSIKLLSSIGLQELIASTAAVSILLGELVGASVILSKFADGKSVAGASSIIIMAAALAILAPVMKYLGGMEWEDILKALTAFAGILGLMVAAGYAMKQVIKPLIAGAAAMALFGAGVALLGVGLLLAGTGLSGLAVGIVAFAGAIVGSAKLIVSALKTILTGVAEMIPLFVEKIAEGIMRVLNIISNNEEAMKGAFMAILRALLGTVTDGVPEIVDAVLKLIIGVLDKLNEKIPELVDNVFKLVINIIDGLARNLPELIASGANLVKALIEGIIDAMAKFSIDNIDDLQKAAENLLGVMLILGAISAIFPFAFAGVLALGTIALELTGVLAALGGISKIPGIMDLIGSGGDLLEKIGQAIGKFIGGLVGEVMVGVASQLPTIAAALSAFAMHAVPFIAVMKMVDSDVLEGAGRLAGALLAITAADILTQIAGFFGADVSFETLGDKLVNLGNAMVRFAESTADLDPDSFNRVVDAAGGLVDLAKSLPNTEGLWGWIAGKEDLGGFGDKLAQLATGLVSFAEAARGISEEDCTSMINVAGALDPIVDLSSKLPNTEGAWGWIAGKQDLGEFGDKLGDFATGLTSFAEASRGISEEDCTSMKNVADALNPVVDLSNKLPNTEGAWGWIAGKEDIGGFGTKLGDLAKGMATFAEEAAKVSADDITHMKSFVGAVDPFVEIANKLPNTEGAWGWLSGKADLGDFGKNLKSFGEGVSGFAENIRGITASDITTMTDVKAPVDSLADMATKMDSVSDVKKLKTFSGTLKDFAKNIKGFVSTWTKDVNSSDLDTALGEANKIVDFANRTVNEGALTSIANGINAMAGASLTGFVTQFNGRSGEVESAIKSFLSGALSSIRGKYSDFFGAGSYLIQGFVKGMRSQFKPVRDTAGRVGQEALDELTHVTRIESPSKETTEYGRYFGRGFVNGVSEYIGIAGTAAADVGESALDGLQKSLNDPFGTDGFDNTITIKPVIDLSEIQNGTSEIDRMLGGLNGYAINGSLGLSRSTADSMSGRGNGYEVNGFDKVTKAVENLGDKLEKPVEQHNNFNFYGATNDEIIREVKKTLTRDIIKEGRKWA